MKHAIHAAHLVIIPFLCCCMFLIVTKVCYIFSTGKYSAWKQETGCAYNILQRFLFYPVLDFAKFYHGYEIHDANVIGDVLSNGNSCLLVSRHSRCTADLIYFMCSMPCRVVASHLLGRLPFMAQLMPWLGIVPSVPPSTLHSNKLDKHTSRDTFFQYLLQSDRPMMLLPGGAYECLLPYVERDTVHWKEEPGFTHIIRQHYHNTTIDKDIVVVPFYTRNCNEIYLTSSNWFDFSGDWSFRMYNAFKRGHYWIVPFMMTLMLTSFGFFVMPRPVKLDVYFGEAVKWRRNDTAKAFARRVKHNLQTLIDTTNKLEDKPIVTQRGVWWWIYTFHTLCHNVALLFVLLTLIWLPFPLYVLAYIVSAVVSLVVPREKSE